MIKERVWKCVAPIHSKISYKKLLKYKTLLENQDKTTSNKILYKVCFAFKSN